MDMSINLVQTHLVARACRIARIFMVSRYLPQRQLAITEQSMQANIFTNSLITTGMC